MEIESMGDDWFVGLRGEMVKQYFLDVSRLPSKQLLSIASLPN